MAEKQQYKTPRGALKYPYLTGEGRDFQGDKRFHFSTKFVVPPGADADKFREELDRIAVEGLASLQNSTNEKVAARVRGKKDLSFSLYTILEDGSLQVNFKVPTTVTSKKTGQTYSNRPRMFDAKLQPIPSEIDLKLGTGTQARVTFTAYAWVNPAGLCGVRLEPRALQILNKVERTGGFGSTADDFGFGEEDGFTYEGGADAEDAPTAGATGEL